MQALQRREDCGRTGDMRRGPNRAATEMIFVITFAGSHSYVFARCQDVNYTTEVAEGRNRVSSADGSDTGNFLGVTSSQSVQCSESFTNDDAGIRDCYCIINVPRPIPFGRFTMSQLCISIYFNVPGASARYYCDANIVQFSQCIILGSLESLGSIIIINAPSPSINVSACYVRGVSRYDQHDDN